MVSEGTGGPPEALLHRAVVWRNKVAMGWRPSTLLVAGAAAGVAAISGHDGCDVRNQSVTTFQRSPDRAAWR